MVLKKLQIGVLSLLSCLVVVCAVANEARAEKIRIIVESDLPGGDPDDEGSMTRFFMYLNEFDVEGIIGTRNASQSRTSKDAKEEILGFVDAYEKVYPSLSTHAEGYPTPASLRLISKQCFSGSEGRDLIIKAVDKADSRPLVISNWGTNEGNKTSTRQALDHIKATRSDADYKKFAKKIIMCEGGGQESCYQLQAHYSNFLLVIDTFMPKYWYRRFGPLTETAGGFDINRDVKKSHGELGAKYTITKEGDSPCFLHCLPTGLIDVRKSHFGSWGGRFGFADGKYQCSVNDNWQGTTNRDNTLKRWAVHLQHDFAARADWCIKPVAEANHPPKPVVNGDKTMDIITLSTKAGASVTLNAAGSSDPDNNSLSYEWVYYPEPGTYTKSFSLTNTTKESITFTMPADLAKTDSLHIILIATDNGTPTLTRYRRVILTGNGSGGSTKVEQTPAAFESAAHGSQIKSNALVFDLRGRSVQLQSSSSAGASTGKLRTGVLLVNEGNKTRLVPHLSHETN
jgi:hypothetical protein